MKGLKPQTTFQKVCAAEFPYEVIVALCTLGGTSWSAQRFFVAGAPDPTSGYVTIAFGVVICLTLLVRAVARNLAGRKSEAPLAVVAALSTLHATLQGFRAGGELRICLFYLSAKAGHVRQVTDYVGPTTPYGADRELLCRCGVVGRAFMSGSDVFDKLPRNTALIDHLVTFGFTREEAAAMRQDRKTWAALPIGEPGAIVAVLFLDAATADYFGTAAGNVRKIIDSAKPGIAEFLAKI